MRLKVELNLLKGHVITFQFQTGAIRRLFKKRKLMRNFRGFNSKLVRLEEEKQVGCYGTGKGFQFQTGSIKSL